MNLPNRPAPLQLDDAALQRLRELDPHGQAGLIERVMKAFEVSLQRLLPDLVRACRADDLAAVRLISHTLKSSANIVGAAEMARQCAAIEAIAREQRNDGLAPRIEAVLAESVRVQVALQQLPERAA